MKTLVLTCLVFFASTAVADPKQDAEASYKHGQSLYQKQDYIGAAHHFKLAYDADPDPVYLFNIAQAHRLAKNCKDASDYYNRFLVEAKNAPNQEAVKSYIVEVDACAKAQQPTTTTTATIPTTTDPAPQPFADDPQPRSKKRLVGYIVGGSGVALVGLGFYFMSRVAALEDQANELCIDPCTEWNMTKTMQREDIDGQAHLREKLMVGSWIAGAAAIGAGIYLVVTGGEKSESSISITPTKNGAMASFRF
jgi:tetratricopeptide (TPR) repeat protein